MDTGFRRYDKKARRRNDAGGCGHAKLATFAWYPSRAIRITGEGGEKWASAAELRDGHLLRICRTHLLQIRCRHSPTSRRRWLANPGIPPFLITACNPRAKFRC